MHRAKCMKMFATLIGLAVGAHCGMAYADTVSPIDNVSVYRSTQNQSYTLLGGMYAGNTGGGEISRIYEKFVLPSYVAGTQVTSAIFTLNYTGSTTNGSGPLSVFETSPAWTQSNITWPGKPAPIGSPLATINPTLPNTTVAVDLTSFVNAAYMGNSGTLSFLIMSPQEGTAGNDWRNFGQYGKTLTYTVTAIPEPETYAMMLAGLGLLGVAARRRRQKNATS